MSYHSKGFQKYMKLHMTHKEIFGRVSTMEDILEDIRKIDRDSALTILSGFGTGGKSNKDFTLNLLKPFLKEKDIFILESFEIFHSQAIMHCMKWVIAYGSPRKGIEVNNKYIFDVFRLYLKTSDDLNTKMETDDFDSLLIKSNLFYKRENLDRPLIRYYEMFEVIAKDKSICTSKEFLDIHKFFEEKYQYKILDYVSVCMGIASRWIHQEKQNVWKLINAGINSETYFSTYKNRDAADLILESLSNNVDSIKEKCKSSLLNPYDFDCFWGKPLIKLENSMLILSSLDFLNATVFESLFYKIRKCFDNEDTKWFDFYGRIFETYVSKICCRINDFSKIKSYKYIPEFKYGKSKMDSSDSYVRLGNHLLIIECKSGRINKKTKLFAEEEMSEKDLKKYVIDPIVNQANKRYKDILESNQKDIFKDIKKVYIISVSQDSYPKYKGAYSELESDLYRSTFHNSVKEYDFLGITEFENLMYGLSKINQTIFKLISEKKLTDKYLTYDRYLYIKVGQLKRTIIEEEILKKVLIEIKKNSQFIKTKNA